VPGVPSPWGEAAKGILYMKKIPYVAVRLDPRNQDLLDWTRCASGPVALYEDEAPRSGWAEILVLAERIAPEPRLLPEHAQERAAAFGLAHEICGELGLGWMRRLQAVQAGLAGEGGFPRVVSQYLGDKYGYREETAADIEPRVIELLDMLARRLHAQRNAGHPHYFGAEPSVVDIYSATFMALFGPLPEAQCPMSDVMRASMGTLDEPTRRALDPILMEHRDFMYRDHLEVPLTLT
jgi:glutathione S-transferase